MIDIQITTPSSVSDNFNKVHHAGVYYEIPAVFNQDGSLNEDENNSKVMEHVASVSGHSLRTQMAKTIASHGLGVRDRVYVDKQVVRHDASLHYDLGKQFLAELQAEFPDSFVDYGSRMDNVIGKYGAYREPYENLSFSWYEFVMPSAELLQRYKIDPAEYPNTILPWYGLKHDLVTREIWMKLVIGALPVSAPSLPFGQKFYAVTYRPDGTRDPHVDAYITTTAEFMRDYCQKAGLPFPADDVTASEITMWGVVFNCETMNVTTVKAYYEFGEETV